MFCHSFCKAPRRKRQNKKNNTEYRYRTDENDEEAQEQNNIDQCRPIVRPEKRKIM